MEKHAAFYFWHPMLTQGTYVAAAAAAGILIHRQIIWVKPVLLLGRGDYHWRHELCFYGWQQGNRPPFYGPRNQDTIWEVASVSNAERKEMNHATPKPVALWDKPIANHTHRGEILYEPFAGSGTQIIAAEATGRRCFAMEIDANNTDVCVRRWETFTKKQATLANDGRTWAELAAEAAQDAPDAAEPTSGQVQGK
jgi:DNA modification methylase